MQLMAQGCTTPASGIPCSFDQVYRIEQGDHEEVPWPKAEIEISSYLRPLPSLPR